MRARINPALVLDGEPPHLLDEWQEVPGIWDAVRFDVDQHAGFGKYILTGSITPPRESYEHSGTGRIATLKMYPLTLFESGDSVGSVSFGALFQGEKIKPLVADMDLIRLIDITVRGGWPETLGLPIEKAGGVAADYINAVVRNELFNKDVSKRNPAKLRRLLRAIARNNATTVTDKTLSMDIDGVGRRDQSAEEVMISKRSVAEYSADLKKIFVIEDIPAWEPEIRSKTRIRMASKRVFVDPSLAIAALGIGRSRLLEDLNTFGFMFENLCIRDLSVYAAYHNGMIAHYRDNSGLEADAVVEMPDGAWGAFEIKLGENQVDAAAKTLVRMGKKMIDAGANPPACLCVITGGGFGMLREDGVYVIPINALRP
jgi:predicted AAA+ superfamily ATPase